MPVTRESLRKNPLVELFPSLEDAYQYAIEMEKLCGPEKESLNKHPPVPKEKEKINEYIEKIFGITLNKDTTNSAVFLKDVAESCRQTWLDLDILEQALFERLLLENPSLSVVNRNEAFYVQEDPISYLYECYDTIQDIILTRPNVTNSDLRQMHQLILRNVSTALKQPELYGNHNIPKQLFSLFQGAKNIEPFFTQLVAEIIRDEPNADNIIISTFKPTLDLVQKKISESLLSTLKQEILFFLKTLAQKENTGYMLFQHSTPPENSLGIEYGSSLLGSLLSISCLPKRNTDPVQFYDNVEDAVLSQNMIWTNLDSLQTAICEIFRAALQAGPKSKASVLTWIKNALKSNFYRGSLANVQASAPAMNIVSHAFMLNLTAVLLELCEPIVTSDTKLLKVNMKYPSMNQSIFQSETCLLPGEDYRKAYADQMDGKEVNFITECFFFAHKALDLGFRVCADEALLLNQSYERAMEAHADVVTTSGSQSEVAEATRRRATTILERYLATRAAIMQPRILVKLCSMLFVATSRLICHLIAIAGSKGNSEYGELKTLKFPVSGNAIETFSCIPEFLIENINCWVLFVSRFDASVFEMCRIEHLEHLLNLFVVLAGSEERVRNPHLRANLAQSIEALTPKPSEMNANLRTQLFVQHNHLNEVVPALLSVFVSIEMTGQSVQFEQKFNYRRPIYLAMHYLWTIPPHRLRFKELAKEAESNMEAVNPPLFLRFINLLMNDAVFLLDEALANMKQIKTLQQARESRNYSSTPVQEREQNERMLYQIGMLAKFDNVLGRLTIRTLSLLTTKIKSIFTHSTLVDRIAGMANYFLLNLVGPNKKNFKVKDQKEFEFQPGVVVTHICEIYVNLQNSDDFCLAVSRDGRSYSPQLFVLAQEVLTKIGKSMLAAQLQQVAVQVAREATKQEEQEELLANAPENYLDPIMSTLMLDPVILPSSKVVIDRATIARHLLSDQSDPFNRSPLTMNMVQPADNLREEIHRWIHDRQQKAIEKSAEAQEEQEEEQDSTLK